MTTWQPAIGGHAHYCAHPAAHGPGTWCAADPAEPQTMRGEPSHAYLADHTNDRHCDDCGTVGTVGQAVDDGAELTPVDDSLLCHDCLANQLHHGWITTTYTYA